MKSITENKLFILLMSCLAIFFPGAFVFGYPGIMPAHWQQTFLASQTDIGRTMFFILAGTGFSMYTVGKLQEKIKFHYLIFTGTLICSLVMFYAARAQSITDIYLWAFLSGFFCGFVYVPVLTVTQILFAPKTGWATGIVNLTFGGAAAVFSPIFSWAMIHKGAMAATDIAALIALVCGPAAALLIRIPGEKGVRGRHAQNAALSGFPVLSLGRTLTLPSFWFLWFVWAFAGASGISMIVLSGSIGANLGYDISQFVYILIGFNVMNGAGRLICGRLSDTFARQKILMTCFLLSASAYLVLLKASHLAVVSIMAALVGLSFGAMFTVSAPLILHCFGLVNFGRIFGLVFTAYGFVAGMLGPWLSGVMLDRSGGAFAPVYAYFAVLYMISAFLITRVKKINVDVRS